MLFINFFLRPLLCLLHAHADFLHFLQFEEKDLPVSPSRQRTMSYAQRLPKGWETHIEPYDRSWIGQVLFKPKRCDGKCVLSDTPHLWYSPPELPNPTQPAHVQPVPELYFRRSLLLWMPRRMWNTDLACPTCKPRKSLPSKVGCIHLKILILLCSMPLLRLLCSNTT